MRTGQSGFRPGAEEATNRTDRAVKQGQSDTIHTHHLVAPCCLPSVVELLEMAPKRSTTTGSK